MSDPPHSVRNHARAGDPAISPLEYEVLSRKHRIREKWRTNWFFTFYAALGGISLCLAVDFLIWMASGSLPYMQHGTDGAAWLVGLVTGIVTAVLTTLLGRAKLLPLALMTAMIAGTLTSCLQYRDAIAAEGRVETGRFYVRSLDMYSAGRGRAFVAIGHRPLWLTITGVPGNCMGALNTSSSW